jgi:hypothetical protein
LPIEPWEQLWGLEDAIQAKVTPFQWYEYNNGLNRMTVSDFLEAIVVNNLIIHKFEIVLDRNFHTIGKYLDKINLADGVSKTDPLVEGIMCELSVYN